MSSTDFAELAGRCEALARFNLALAIELSRAGLIDGASFARRLGNAPEHPEQLSAQMQAAHRTLGEMACHLERQVGNQSR